MRLKTCKIDYCGGIVKKTFNAENEPIYECLCCGNIEKRRINKSVKRDTKQANFDDLIAELLKEEC